MALWDRIVGFLTGRSELDVWSERQEFEYDTDERSAPVGDAVGRHITRAAELQDLEYVILAPHESWETRHSAARRWSEISERPLKPLVDINPDYFWKAYREAYDLPEQW